MAPSSTRCCAHRFSPKYVDYVDVKVKGPFKGEHYRYLSPVKKLMNNAFINNMGHLTTRSTLLSQLFSYLCLVAVCRVFVPSGRTMGMATHS